MATETLPRRIEVEDLLPGDTFEYEYHNEWDREARNPRNYGAKGYWGWTVETKQDTVRLRKPMPIRRVIKDSITCPDASAHGGWFLPADAPEHHHLVPAADFGKKEWNKPPSLDHVWAEPGELFEDAAYLWTVQGQNNHGYVVLKPKTVVVLIERAA